MKTLIQLLGILMFLSFTSPLYSQNTCFPGGILFQTQQEIDDFIILNPNCTVISGTVTINDGGTSTINDLSGLQNITAIGGNLDIINDKALSSFNGLNNLQSIGGFFRIYNLINMSDLNGLDQLTTIGGELHLYTNDYLQSLHGLEQLTSVNDITIHFNPFLNDISALSNITSLNGYLLLSKNNALTSFNGLHNITSVGGYVRINSNNGITNLNDFSNLVSIGNYLHIDRMNGLHDLTGLDALQSLGGFLYIDRNDNLDNLSGMPQLTAVGGYLGVYRNPSLDDLDGLQNITSVGTNLIIGLNDGLINLNGLENLTSINGHVYVGDNPALQTLSGIDNIDYTTISYVYLWNSTNLSYCNVTSICNHILTNGPTSITGNAFGCNTSGQIQNGCASNCALGDITLSITDYPFSNNQLTEACVGERVNFAANLSGQLSGNGIPIKWEVNEGNGWTPLNNPPYIGYQFSVIPTSNALDCATSTTGFIDQKYRANMYYYDASIGQFCSFTSDEYDLRLCCPISNGGLIANPSTLCEETTTTINLGILTPDLFVQMPGQYVDIKWYLNGNPLGSLYDDKSNFNYILQVPAVSVPTDYCFTAEVSNCANKVKEFTKCVTVDPQPECGTIVKYSANLHKIADIPHLTYEICPGEDAIIGEGAPFKDCNRNWQYTFDINSNIWIDEGSSSNPVLNTNTLPWDFNWEPGATSIYYRIECKPLSANSGCTPCYSEPVEIRLKPTPGADFINGPNQVCVENLPVGLSVNNYNSAYNYTWYCDGLAVGNGPSYTSYKDKSACFEVAISNGCETITTPLHCIEVCEIIPIISCPLPPNEGACPGAPITLSACDTQFNCGNVNDLLFFWTIDGVMQLGGSNCVITHTPLLSGSTYELTVKHLSTGCEAHTATTIKPCI